MTFQQEKTPTMIIAKMGTIKTQAEVPDQALITKIIKKIITTQIMRKSE